jgi:hypothetical protein
MKASGITYNPRKNRLSEEGKVLEYDFERIKTTDLVRFYWGPSVKDKA